MLKPIRSAAGRITSAARRFLVAALACVATLFGLQSAAFGASAAAPASTGIGLSAALEITSPDATPAATPGFAPIVPGADFVGLNVQTALKFQPVASWGSYLGALPAGGMRIARVEANWTTIEPAAPSSTGTHAYRWDGGPWGATWSLDAQIGALARLGVRAVPVVAGAPAWAGAKWIVDAAHHADYAALIAAIDARYGQGGTFWRTFTAAPARPVLAYEIYNEVNAGTIDAARYAGLLNSTSAALRRQRSTARLMASLAWSDASPYLEALWAAGGGSSLGGVAFHAYGMDAVGSLALLRDLRQTLTALGAGALPITVTEIGQPADLDGPGADSSRTGRISDAARAGHQELVMDAVARGDCGVDHMLEYSILQSETDREPLQEGYMGMLRSKDAAPTRTLLALQRSSLRWTAEVLGNASRGRTLNICGTRPVDPQLQLPLTLSLRSPDTSTECLTADIAYQGNPVELATLTLRVGDRTIPVDADGHGVARLCLPDHFTDAAFDLVATVADVARSARISCITSTLACTITDPAPEFWNAGESAATPDAPSSSVLPPHDPTLTPTPTPTWSPAPEPTAQPTGPAVPWCGWVHAPTFTAAGAARVATAARTRRRGSVQVHLACTPLKARRPQFRVSVIRAGRKQAKRLGRVKLRNGSATSFTPAGRFGAGDRIVLTRGAQPGAGVPRLTATAVVPR